MSLSGDHFGDHMGDKIVEIGVQMSGQKSSENRLPNSVMLGSILGTIFESKVGRLPVEEPVCVACWGQGSWIYQNGSQNRRCWVLKSMIFVACFDSFFVVFCV